MDAKEAYLRFLSRQQMAQRQPRDPNNPYPHHHYQTQHPSQTEAGPPGQTPQQQPSYPPPSFDRDDGNNHHHHDHQGGSSSQPYQNYGQQNPRAPPMRLDLPPPPVFTTAASPNTDFPNHYGPPSGLLYSPMGQPSPNKLHPPHPTLSPMYATPYPQNESGGYFAPLPTSPYAPTTTPGYQHSPTHALHLQHEQQAHLQQPQQYQQHENVSHGPQQHPPLAPVYYTPHPQHPFATSASSNGSGNMNEYFPPYSNSTPFEQTQQLHPPQRHVTSPIPSPTYPVVSNVHITPDVRPELDSGAGSSASAVTALVTPALKTGPASGGSGPKTSRQQFSACGACRHRRVKCDLKDRQEEADLREAAANAARGPGPIRRKPKKEVDCTNCTERGMQCVDDFAPMKAVKQLRRGKRISEIETLYGKNSAARAGGKHGKAKVEEAMIPELTPEFFQSGFFRSFQVQRPVLDPTDFVARYLSFSEPCAANLGPEGALLCHVLYAWAVSYGVDEHGHLDVPEGGTAPLSQISLLEPGKEEIKREEERSIRFGKMRCVVEIILEEIDACGVMRKPTWDGARTLLLFLPLTEGVSTPVERLAMYECALSQVFMLCSYGAMGYDGQAAGTSGVNGGSDEGEGRDLNIVRIRTYWYAFVHEGITTGLKGGRLLLDGDDLETIQDSISNRTLVSSSPNFMSASRMAVAPINLALACRLINRALTGPTARRRNAVNASHVKEAWEALEACWEEFETIRTVPPAQYSSQDEIIRFVDGWKIFLFEAQNVIRTNLEERLTKLSSTVTSASITDASSSQSQQDNIDIQILNVAHLLEIAQAKCDVQTRLIMEIVRRHLGTGFFEWDASLVRDGTYYAAMLLAKRNGSDDDVACCVQALNELRWAHAKAWSRSADLRREWAIRSAHSSIEQNSMGWDGPALQMSIGNLFSNSAAQYPEVPTAQTSISINTSLNTQSTRTHSHTHPNPRSLVGTDSSHSNSPYTSASSLVSPIYEASGSGGGLKMGLGPLANQQGQAMNRIHGQGQGLGQAGDGQWSHAQIQPMGPPTANMASSTSTYGQEGSGFFDQPQQSHHQHPESSAYHQHQQYQQHPHQQPQPMMTYHEMQELGLIPQVQAQGQQQHSQEQVPTGRYVSQPDGSQVYVPYDQE